VGVHLSGLVESLVINDVDVTAYVEGELDKRHPERVQLRAMRTAGDYRAMWDTIEDLWSQTVARAGRLPERALHQRVDDEWSFAETLRHLILATDKWAGHAWGWCAASSTASPMTTWIGNARACPAAPKRQSPSAAA